jgi:hypothetical protein
MNKEKDNNVSNEIAQDPMEVTQEASAVEKLGASTESAAQENKSAIKEETYEEREARLDAEEKIVKRNCIIFGVLPLFIGFWVFCYYFFQYLEEHKISLNNPASPFYCENQIDNSDIL